MFYKKILQLVKFFFRIFLFFIPKRIKNLVKKKPTIPTTPDNRSQIEILKDLTKKAKVSELESEILEINKDITSEAKKGNFTYRWETTGRWPKFVDSICDHYRDKGFKVDKGYYYTNISWN